MMYLPILFQVGLFSPDIYKTVIACTFKGLGQGILLLMIVMFVF